MSIEISVIAVERSSLLPTIIAHLDSCSGAAVQVSAWAHGYGVHMKPELIAVDLFERAKAVAKDLHGPETQRILPGSKWAWLEDHGLALWINVSC